MAPPQLFINTKTLELEKQPKDNKGDGDEAFEPENQHEEEADKNEKEDDKDNCDPDQDTNGTGNDGNRRNEKWITILTSMPIFIGLAVAVFGVSSNKNDLSAKSKHLTFLQAFLWNVDLVSRYFYVLGLHLFSLLLFYTSQACLLPFENHKNLQRLKIGKILSVANFIFIIPELNLLVSKQKLQSTLTLLKSFQLGSPCCDNFYSLGLLVAGLFSSMCLALPWPLACGTDTLPTSQNLRKITNSFQSKHMQLAEMIRSSLPSL